MQIPPTPVSSALPAPIAKLDSPRPGTSSQPSLPLSDVHNGVALLADVVSIQSGPVEHSGRPFGVDATSFQQHQLLMQEKKTGNDRNLLNAIRHRDVEAALEAIHKGSGPNATNSDGDRAISLAIRARMNPVVERMLQYPDITMRRADGTSLIDEARSWDCYDRGKPNILSQLQHFDDARAHPERRAWVKAAVAGDVCRLAEINERHGRSSIDRFTSCSQPAIWYSANHGELSAVKSLVAWGANPDIHDGDGDTPLSTAAYNNHPHVVEFLLTLPVQPNVLDSTGNAPLHQAARLGYAAVVETLVKGGADINVRTRGDLNTALHYPAWHGQVEMVTLLLKLGADPLAANKDGKTPFDRARASGSPLTVRAFEEHFGLRP